MRARTSHGFFRFLAAPFLEIKMPVPAGQPGSREWFTQEMARSYGWSADTLSEAMAKRGYGFPTRHPMRRNKDGSQSNAMLASFQFDLSDGTQRYVVIPTMVDGVQLNEDAAVELALTHGIDTYPSFPKQKLAEDWIKSNHGRINEKSRFDAVPTIMPPEQDDPTKQHRAGLWGLYRPQKGKPDQLPQSIDSVIRKHKWQGYH